MNNEVDGGFGPIILCCWKKVKKNWLAWPRFEPWTFRMESEMGTAAPQHLSDKRNKYFNNILKLVRLTSSFSYRGKYKILYLSRSHTEESIKIYTCLVFISRKVLQIFVWSIVNIFHQAGSANCMETWHTVPAAQIFLQVVWIKKRIYVQVHYYNCIDTL